MIRIPDTTFLRFALVGGLNTLLGISLFPLLFWAIGDDVNMNLILVMSYVICTLFAFTMHKFVTFSSKGKSMQQGVKFISLTLVLLGINAVLLNAAIALTTLHPSIAQVIIAVSLQLGNYVVLKRFVFSSGRAK